MQLLKLSDVQLTPDSRIFKESVLVHFIATLIFTAAMIGVYFWYRSGELPLYLFILVGGFLLLFLMISFHSFKKALAGTNWLFAVGPDRVLIKFRSFLNANLPEDDPQVISLSLAEIESAQITKLRLCYPGSENKTTTEFQKYLDLFVNADNLQHLKERLKYEHTAKVTIQTRIGKKSSKSHHYPVSVVDDKVIRILWKSPSSHVKPGIDKVVNLLDHQRVKINPTQSLVNNYTKGAIKEGANADEKILELVRQGKSIAARRLTQQVYDYDMKQAREHIDNLLQQ